MDDAAMPSKHEISKFRVYTLGIVSTNKALDSKDIEFTPMERQTMANGELTDNTVKYDAKAADDQGAAYNDSLDTTSTMKATWLPLGCSNRRTAPDVRRGEQVVIYQFGDSDKYWWMTQMDDFNLRKLETVIYGWSATKDENAAPTAANMYFFELSTHTGHVTFQTSKANGEPFAYTIQINTKDGGFVVKDDTGNEVYILSEERTCRMNNADGSFVEVNKQDINLECSGNVNIKGGKAVNVTSGSTTTFKVGSAYKLTAGATMTMTSPGIGTYNVLAVTGSDGGGAAEISGTLKVRDDIVAGNVSVIHHRHPETGSTTLEPTTGGGGAGGVGDGG